MFFWNGASLFDAYGWRLRPSNLQPDSAEPRTLVFGIVAHPTYGCVVFGKETIGQYSPKFSTKDLPLVVSPILLINYIISKLLIWCFLKQAYPNCPKPWFSDSTWPTSWRVSCARLQSKRLTDLTKSFANFVRPWRRVVRWWPHSWGWKNPKVTAPNSRWLKDPAVAVAFVA